MEIKEIKKLDKNLAKYYCEYCDFKCFQKCDWDRHILRPKHLSNANGNVNKEKKLEKTFTCVCGKNFKTNAGLWKHNNKVSCVKMPETKPDTDKPVIPELNFDKELMLMLINQNKELLEIVKNGTHNTTTTHTNSHNKAFNLNFFLNETCKNAMNITDFVDSIKLQLSDLIDIGDVGFVEGISKIIVKNLNNLDENIRPIHCTDKKRETFYVKDQDQWEKEDEERKRIKKIINKIADKNINLLPQFREKYPEYVNSSSRLSDKYDKMVIEVMSTDVDKKDKIIRNISKVTTINDKYTET
jgi:hypothetical protein